MFTRVWRASWLAVAGRDLGWSVAWLRRNSSMRKPMLWSTTCLEPHFWDCATKEALVHAIGVMRSRKEGVCRYNYQF